MPVLNWKYRNLKCSRTVLVAGELQWMESALSAQQVGRRRTATMISFIFSQGATRIMGTGPSLQCPNQCSLPQVLRLSHFKLISNAIQLVLAQLCCHTYWPRSSLVVGKWAEVASAWPPSGQPCLPLHHQPTHQHLSWATCNFEKRKKGETKLIPMAENDI